VLYPLGEIGVVGDLALELVFTLLLISGVMAVSRKRMARLVIFTIAAATIPSRLSALIYPGTLMATLGYFFGILSIASLIGIILIEVFREGEINYHRIQGAIAVYLLLGILWAFSYRFVALIEPNALILSTHRSLSEAGSERALMHKFIYLSFTTLTTIGSSDIVAVNPLARSLVIVEALIGQLFPAILLARLVSMQVSSRENRSKKSDLHESTTDHRLNQELSDRQQENLTPFPTRSKQAV